MTKLLLQLTWWKIVNIWPFCWLQNECVFCTCEQHDEDIPELQWVNFLQILLFDFFIFLSFWMAFPPGSYFRLLFLQKAIIGSFEKAFSWAIFIFKMDQWFELFFLYWEMWGYMSLSVVTPGISQFFCC